MIRANRYSRYFLTTFAVAVAMLALAACGSTKKKSKTTSSAEQTSAQSAAAQTARQATALSKLPTPEPGVIHVADAESLGITQKIDSKYGAVSSGVTVTPSAESTAQAFSDLCDGKADIAEVTQQPSAAELAQCAANGITFKTNAQGNPVAYTLAADAIVVATKNEANVGGDCLRRQTVRDIFEPGSTIENWDQLGFDNLPLTTSGRAPAFTNVAGTSSEIGTFPLFANLVLGVEGDSSLADVRSDFNAYTTDDDVKNRTIANGVTARILRRERKLIAFYLRTDKSFITAQEAAAAARADAVILRQIRAANAALAKTKKVLTAAQAAAITAANAKLDNAAETKADTIVYDRILARIQTRVRNQFRAQLARAANPGVLGVFRFTYYELYEDKLRPMEIWDPVSSVQELQDEGVATSDSDIADQITINQRAQAGGGTGEVETVSIPSTPTTPGAKYTSDSKQTLVVPGTGPVDVETTPNCIFPSRQTITSGVYPLSVQLMAYVPKRELKRPDVISYLSYYLGAGQAVVDAERLVPVDNTTREVEYKELTGHILPNQYLSAGASPSDGAAGSAGAAGTSTTSSSTADISSSSSAAGSSASSDTGSGQSTNGGVG